MHMPQLTRRMTVARVGLFAALFALGAGSVPLTLLGQERPPAPGGVSAARFAVTLRDADGRLTAIERSFDDLERIDVVSPAFGEAITGPLAAYVSAMTEAFDTAIAEAISASRSQGRSGSVVLVDRFEDLALEHERRTRELDARSQRIIARIKDGALGIDKVLLQSLSPQERGEFRAFLTPDGVRETERRNPGYFKGAPGLSRSSMQAAPSGSRAGGGIASVLGKLSLVLVRPAHAAALPGNGGAGRAQLAATVVSGCAGVAGALAASKQPTPAQQASCDQATAAASVARTQALQVQSACLAAAHGGGNKHWKHAHFKLTMQTACVAVYVARLA